MSGPPADDDDGQYAGDDANTQPSGNAEERSSGNGRRPPEDEEERRTGTGLPGGISRRTLVRLLVGLGIGLPILIEGLTLLGLIGKQFGGPEGTPTRTATADGVGVGDELLPESPPAETVEAAYVTAEGWTFTLTVAVENTSERTYELRLRSVTTDGGRTVEGGGESTPIQPGESGSVTGRWDLPDGASPASVDVVALSRDGTVTKIERTVPLGRVPVSGG